VRRVALPAATAVRFGPLKLRLVLAGEGVPALDGALRDVVTGAAGGLGATVEIEDLDAFAGAGGSGRSGDTAARRLLAQVQAGLPPDALLLAGRQAQTARFVAMGLVQDLSGLMRQVWRRFRGAPPIAEQMHVVAGNWFAVPYYQRLVGHWVREAPFAAAGLDTAGALGTWDALREALRRVANVPDASHAGRRPRGWGIGAADTPDVDAWCWGAIHAWGGALADLKGEHVILASSATTAALEWLAAALADAPGNTSPDGAGPTDAQKNAAFLSGAAAYTFTERVLAGAPGGGGTVGPTASSTVGGAGVSPQPDMADVLYLPAPAGPVSRPRAIGGGAAWFLPRGAPPEPVERLIEAVLDPAAQRRLWQAGGGFVLPAYTVGWEDAAVAALPQARSAARFRDELTNGGFASATGNGGPETAASQAIGEARLAAGMLRAVAAGRPPADVAAEAERLAIQVFRDFGLPGA
jgi:hypothetical protein